MRPIPFTLAVLLSGCITTGSKLAEWADESTGTDAEAGVAAPSGEVLDCDDPQSTLNVRIEFEPIPPGCPFGEDDNLVAEHGIVTARKEQHVPVEVPDSALLCDATLTWDPIQTSLDDQFMVTFNDIVLMASSELLVERLSTADGLLYSYRWIDVRGAEIDFSSDTPTYCVGAREGLSECELPSQGPGLVSLSLDRSINDLLLQSAIEQGHQTFSIITMGDDDADSDCFMEAVRFDWEVSYVAW